MKTNLPFSNNRLHGEYRKNSRMIPDSPNQHFFFRKNPLPGNGIATGHTGTEILPSPHHETFPTDTSHDPDKNGAMKNRCSTLRHISAGISFGAAMFLSTSPRQFRHFRAGSITTPPLSPVSVTGIRPVLSVTAASGFPDGIRCLLFSTEPAFGCINL